MFGWGQKRREQENALRDAVALIASIRQLCLQIDDVDDDLFRGDAYLLGYVTGAVGISLSPFWNRSFTTKQKGRMLIQAWEANGTSGRWAAENVDYLLKSQHLDFLRGMEEASTVLILQCNRLAPHLYDNDVTGAVADAPAIRASIASIQDGTSISLNEAAAIGLHHIYLTRYLKRFSLQ